MRDPNKPYIEPPAHIDITGQRFGNLEVIKQVERDPNKIPQKGSVYLCRCDCGRKTVVRGRWLRAGKVTRCSYCTYGGDKC